MKRKGRGASNGFTMVELMIALFVATLAVVGYVGANIAIQRHAETVHERALATQDATQTIAQMRTSAKTGSFPTNILTAFPNGGTVAGFNNLTNELVAITYANTAANPLDATVTVTWLSYAQQPSTVTLRTYITQR